MLTLIGFVLVIAGVLGGYLLEHGKIEVLIQPAEFVIIGGAALGTFLAANSLRVVKDLAGRLPQLVKPDRYGPKEYLDTLKLLHDLFASARKNGAARLEADIEKPAESPVFSEHPQFLKDHSAVTYLCDTLRVVLMGGVSVFEVEQLMEIDAESHHGEAAEPVAALQTVADALPGLGIVAAVLGIVITMGALGGPPEEIGHKVAAALVGTFLGILLCYGFLGPLATRLSKINEAEGHYLTCLRHGVLAYVRGYGPLLAAEFARRSIPPHVRPAFPEFEAACKGGAPAAVPDEAAAA